MKMQILKKGYMVQNQRNLTKIRNQKLSSYQGNFQAEPTMYNSLIDSSRLHRQHPVLQSFQTKPPKTNFMLTIDEARQRESLKYY